MEATARAPAAISIVNAIPAGTGSAVAIDTPITARVRLDPTDTAVTASVADRPDIDVSLVRRCLDETITRYGDGEGGHVETTAPISPSVGLKTSSASANATIMATLAALGRGDEVDPLAATSLGVEVARSVGVTVTGAFDDATASMLGGLTITNNETDELLAHRELTGEAVILIPEGRTPTATVDTEALDQIAPLSELAVDEVLAGRHETAMAINGLAVASALNLDRESIRLGMRETMAVSPSGTGPAVAAIASASSCATIAKRWEGEGTVVRTQLQSDGVTLG